MSSEHEEAVRLFERAGASANYDCMRQKPNVQFMMSASLDQLAALIAEVRRKAMGEAAQDCEKVEEECRSRGNNWQASAAYECAANIRARLEEGK